MTIRLVFRSVGVLLFAAVYASCIPYAVGSTARPARKDNTQITVSTFALPKQFELQQRTDTAIALGVDVEARRGISPQSDVGLRLTSGSGVVLTYKRRLDGVSDKAGPGIAVQVGGGILNTLEQGEGEATLIVSGGEEGRFTPYGGLRAVYTVALVQYAANDKPVFGGYFGFRFGTPALGVSAELGVFHEHNAYPIQKALSIFEEDKRRLAIVPSISLHADVIGWVQRLRDRNRHQ
ncbi:MAG: hypothetical protein ABJB74_14590 [Gemmatimonas sp.]